MTIPGLSSIRRTSVNHAIAFQNSAFRIQTPWILAFAGMTIPALRRIRRTSINRSIAFQNSEF
jgi:hypothetical protein